MCNAFGDMPERTDRRDDELVVMPDIEQEAIDIALKHGLPMPQRASKRLPPTEDQIVDEPEIREVTGQAGADCDQVTGPIETSAAACTTIGDSSEAVNSAAMVG